MGRIAAAAAATVGGGEVWLTGGVFEVAQAVRKDATTIRGKHRDVISRGGVTRRGCAFGRNAKAGAALHRVSPDRSSGFSSSKTSGFGACFGAFPRSRLGAMYKFTPLVALLLVRSALADDALSNDPIVVSSETVQIRRSAFDLALKSFTAQSGVPASATVKKELAATLLTSKVMAAEAVKSGLENDPEVMRKINSAREFLLADAQRMKILRATTVTEAELRQQYEALAPTLEYVRARQILITFKGAGPTPVGRPERTEEQARVKAEAVLRQLQSGAAFAEVAKRESDDASAAGGGVLPEIYRKQTVPEFEAAAFSTPVGGLSPVIKTQFGFVIIRVDAKVTRSFDELRANLESSERGKRAQAAIDDLVRRANATYDPAYFGAP